MNWLRKRIDLKPALLVGVILALLLAGAGLAYALTIHTLGGSMYPARTTIIDAEHLSVNDTKPTYYPGYQLIFNEDMSSITNITVYVNNTDVSNHDGIVVVQVYDSGDSKLCEVRSSEITFTAGTTAPVTLSLTGVTPGNIDYIHITLYETS